ncbi:ubiquitin carboxyl-terminal hydrolase Usp2 isoform X4 [Anopheles arabiensis]|uniref:ubiquitin carboxyl-terminal hydrolase Usp2 isoform X4 n=1 Tax=Anopheles arabiensis TaxID=7173 RepID=UPI001AADE56C|nr:ubiquitin carboxyl-terminal hydrolase Usp2 isoform X4 [Anopheles arabiensis]
MPVTSTYSSSGSRYIQPPASQFSKSSFSDRVYYSPLLNSTKTSSFRNSSLYRNSSTTSLRNNSSYVSNIRNTALCGAEIYQRYSLSTYKPAASVSSRITQLSLAYSGRFPKANSASSSLETSSTDLSEEKLHNSRSKLQPRINLNKQQTSPKTNEREEYHYPNKSPSSARHIKPSLNYERCTEVNDSLRNTREGLCGLWNIGNTCFMNSMIQCLSHTRELTSFLRGQSSSESGTSKDHLILAEYTKLIKNMWSGTQRSINPSDLKYAFSSKHRMYSGSAQQDAQEFLRFFLDSLHGALNVAIKRDPLSEIDDNMNNKDKADMLWEWYSKAENSMIKDLFVGQLRSTLKCTFCNMESTMFDPFWDLSVPLPSSSSRCKLENCLEMFIKEEIMDGIDQPTCSNCDTRRKCTKRLTIERFPRYLVIHLKRFSEARWSKLTNIVEFPTKNRALNLQPYASEDISGPIYYSLYGISNHMGSTAGGHYVAVCKHPQTQQWNEFNDNYVTEAFERNLVTSNAYVLFYERA